MKTRLLTSVAMAACALAAQTGFAHANTLVSTIDGGYDLDAYDTISLRISNVTAFNFSNAQMELKGYQGINNGVDQTYQLGAIGAGTVDTVIWGVGASNGYPVHTSFIVPGDLFTGDYDDSWTGDIGSPDCVQGHTWCVYTGNFSVTFTAHWDNPAYNSGAGVDIFSQFSPNNNASGGFVAFEGLDPSGLAETVYDDHSGSPNGVLANIYVGDPGDFNPNGGVPEPATWALMLGGLGLAGAALRRRRAQTA